MDAVRDRVSTRVGRRRPPPRYRLEDYKRWFPATGRLFLDYLRRSRAFEGPAGPGHGGVAAVVIVPWVSTPTPWYAVMLALGLRRRGRDVVLVWDDTGFPELFVEQQNQVLSKVLDYVGRYLTVVRVSAEPPGPEDPGDAAAVKTISEQNVVWILRGEANADIEQELTAAVAAALSTSLPRIRSALDRVDPDVVVVSGGVYSTSGLFHYEAVRRGTRVATFDADRGIGQLCVSGIAAQSRDIPRAFDALWSSGPETVAAAVAIAQAEFDLRTKSKDGYGFQAYASTGTQAGTEGNILMPLNVEWDTAALGRHIHFGNTLTWLSAAISVILAESQSQVIVRQHPSERRETQRGKLAIREHLREQFGEDPRVRFVAADDPVNTYDLLRESRLVLPYVSTIAVEAAALGKPTLISGACYYDSLGVVWTGSSPEDYLATLRRGLRGELELLPDQVQRAWVCYYLTAVRNRIPTNFTPQPDDFWDWSQRDPDSLFADPEIADVLTAIDQNEPVSLLRHRRLLAHAPAG